jgi:hypothetical protein
MTPREALADYLLIRRRVGFKLEGDQRLLENLIPCGRTLRAPGLIARGARSFTRARVRVDHLVHRRVRDC